METISLNIGDYAPEFSLQDNNRNEVGITDFRGRWVVLYFYPENNTPGCTQEALEFTSFNEDFLQFSCYILGVNNGSVESHNDFINKNELKVILLSDPENKVSKLYDAYDNKIIRSTFLVNPEGKIAYSWRNVKAQDHAKEVYEKLKELF